MSEMVERVAKAIASATYDGLASSESIECARAAIAAMREPTPEMIAIGGGDLVAPIGRQNAHRVANHIWQAMIDEALE